ncbi:sialoadhesin-like isoform X1 [Pelobates cultripes]|uniref:Sialoadhesin-like isoform X1 n=3 Tax=Pelobates cultripes TaxID=61616 RepID=A0AAD1WR30_PELCU|nr:sialoadhesin-like isoform X1 [Pelobates cultripes]
MKACVIGRRCKTSERLTYSDTLNIMSFNKTFLLIILQGLHSMTVSQTWTFPKQIDALIGSCVVIPCSFTRARSSMSDDVVWYLYRKTSYPEVFNSRGNSETISAYRGRTSLVSAETMSCTLRINYVRSEDEAYYYPGIDTRSNAYREHRKTVRLLLREKPHDPVIQWSGEMIEGQPITITCKVEHTCQSNAPTIGWNKGGQHGNTNKSNFTGGGWTSVSELIYTPSSNDHNTQIVCSAVHHNGKISQSSTTLDIKSVEIYSNTLIFVVTGIIVLILFALVGCIYWRYGKCQEFLSYMRNCTKTSHSPDALYADLQKENISPEYDRLKPKVQDYLQVKETKIDELPKYENV